MAASASCANGSCSEDLPINSVDSQKSVNVLILHKTSYIQDTAVLNNKDFLYCGRAL